MLRSSYMKKYMKKDKAKYEIESKFIKEDDEYILRDIRPINEKSVRSVPPSNLNRFAEDVMTDKKLCRVIYAGNAGAEIKAYKAGNDAMSKTLGKLKAKKPQDESSDIVKNRERRETTNQIKAVVEEFKLRKKKEKEELTKKNNKNYYKFKRENQRDRKNYFQPIKDYKMAHFKNMFYSLTDKCCALEGKENHDFDFDTLYPKETISTRENDLYYNIETGRAAYLESKISGLDRTNDPKKVVFPDMSVNMNDVYSRLYHNSVLLTQPKKSKTLNVIGRSRTKKTDEKQTTSRNKLKFKIRNVIKSTNGKEFTIKINDDVINKCFFTYSGGPESIQALKALAKEKSPNGEKEIREDEVDFYSYKGKCGNTFLHFLTLDDLPDMAKYFIQKGSDVNAQNENGDTPLHLALTKKHYDMVELLLNSGAAVDIKNAKGEIPYDLATNEIKKKYGFDKYIIMSQNKKYREKNKL